LHTDYEASYRLPNTAPAYDDSLWTNFSKWIVPRW